MRLIKLSNTYGLNVVSESEDFIDTQITYEGTEIGELLLTIHKDEVFIRQISIKKEFRRKGHSTQVIDLLREYYKKPISLCISKHSESAVGFWKNYFIGKKAVNVRGDIYKVA